MDRIVKLNSSQGGPFTSAQNLVDFYLPADGVYDLSSSYINLNAKINVTESETTSGQGIYPMDLQWKVSGGENPKFQNVALVKNCSMSCANKGQIENIRRIDVLKQNLASYTKTQREDYDESYLASNNLINPINRNQFSIYRDIEKTGSVKSRNLDILPIQIRLSDLFEFCRAEEYDTRKAGQTRIHLELNADKVEGVQCNQSVNWANEDLKRFQDTAPTTGADEEVNTITTVQKFTNLNLSPLYTGQKLLISAMGSQAVACNDTTGDTNTLTSTADLAEADAPFSVGESVRVQYTFNTNTFTKDRNVTGLTQNGSKLDITINGADIPNGASAITINALYEDNNAVVKTIDWKGTGEMELTFERAWQSVHTAGHYLTDITVATATVSSSTVEFNFAEVVLKRLAKPKGFDDIEYSTYSTEQDNGNNLTSFQRQYQCEAEARNVLILFPNTQSGLVSADNSIKEWRLRENNVDLTDRFVKRKSPLAYDRLAMTLSNMGMTLRNLKQNMGDTSKTRHWRPVNPVGFDDLASAGNTLTTTETFTPQNCPLKVNDKVQLTTDTQTDERTITAIVASGGKLNMTVDGAQLPISTNISMSIQGVYDNSSADTIMIANPLRQTARDKNLQVNIESETNGVGDLFLYKELPRVFSY